MAVAVWAVTQIVGGPTGVAAAVRVVAGAIVGLAVYAGAILLFRVHEATDLVDRVLRRRRSRVLSASARRAHLGVPFRPRVP